MSVATKGYADAAEQCLGAAKVARQARNAGLAASLADAARVNAQLCRGAALTTSFDDVDDIQRAERAASEAEDVTDAGGGARARARHYRPGEWRIPGYRAPTSSASGEAVAALATLDKIAAKARARGTGRR